MAALTYGVVHRAKHGNAESGDAWLVVPGERCLVAVADGLGSGPAAQVASQAAVATIRRRADESLTVILEACDTALQPTRGAAVGILAIEPERRRASFAGVGNIEVRTGGESTFKPISTSGIVGANYRPPRVFEGEYRPGEYLVMHSDGLRTRFDLDRELRAPFETPQELAERLAEGYAREADDLTVVVVRLP